MSVSLSEALQGFCVRLQLKSDAITIISHLPSPLNHGFENSLAFLSPLRQLPPSAPGAEPSPRSICRHCRTVQAEANWWVQPTIGPTGSSSPVRHQANAHGAERYEKYRGAVSIQDNSPTQLTSDTSYDAANEEVTQRRSRNTPQKTANRSKKKFQIATEETADNTIYAAEDRAAARAEFDRLKAAFTDGAERLPAEAAEEVQRRAGTRVRELESALDALEERARSQG
jgi:hypothetical protein